jgi:DNA primase
VAVVESPLDVVRLAALDIPAVATYGAYVSKAQVALLIEHFERLVLALDDDEAGRQQTDRLYRPLARLMPVRRVTFYGAKDPGDTPDAECWEIFSDISGNVAPLPGSGQGADARRQLVPSGSRPRVGQDGHHDRRR